MKKTERDFAANFGKTVRALREHKVMTIRGFAKIAGVSIGALSAIETGKSYPDIITVNRIAVALELPAFFLCWLVELDDPCSIVWKLSLPMVKADDEILVEFGERIRDIRLARDLSLSLAHKAGAPTPSQLSGIERGQTSASMLTLVGLANAYGLPVWRLLLDSAECAQAMVVIEKVTRNG